MLEVQALKGAIALIECDAKSSCEDCYFCAYDCEKGAREVMEVLRKMLEDRGFPYPGENVGEADTRALHNDNEVYPEELEEEEN